MIERRKLLSGAIAVPCHDALESQARWLLNALAAMEAAGSRFKAGQRVQIGWSLLTLRPKGNELVLCEPDYAKDPLRDVREDVTTTLAVLAQMKDVFKRVGAQPSFPRFDDKVVLAKGCLDDSEIYALRSATENERDSGWYVGRESDADREETPELEGLRVYHLLARRRSLLQVLALPVEFMVFFEGDEIRSVLNGKGADVWNR